MKFDKIAIWCALAGLAGFPGTAQTRVDLSKQAKDIDFSAAASTKPSKTGPNLPAACSVGETFLKTTAAPGQNLYACMSTNTWSVQGGAGVSNYSVPFTAATIVTVPGAVHGLGTANLIVECYDGATPANLVEPDAVKVNPATYDVTVTFATPQSGTIIISATGASSAPAGGNSPGMAAQLGDLQAIRSSTTVLTVGTNCSTVTPCNVRIGGATYPITAAATVTLASGSGTAYIYIAPSGALTVGHNVTLSCSAGCAAVTGITGFPVNSIPLFTWSASNGIWDVAGVDSRAFLSSKTITAGTGIVTAETGPQTLVSVDSSTVPTYLTGTATLAFPAIAPDTCAAELTFAIPGAATGDAVAPGWPASLPAGVVGMMRVTAANTVAVRLCNSSGATATPPSALYRASIVRSF